MSKTALITGASAGIGLEFAIIFAKEKYDLVITARNGTKLNELANKLKNNHNVNVKVLTKDLSKQNAGEEIFNELKNEKIVTDILINNAGLGVFDNYWNIELQDEQNMLQVNIMALTELTNLFAKDMVHRGGGKILNVASTAAFQPGPTMAGYYASKAFVLSYSQSVDFELRKKGVQVSTLCPGPTLTEFQIRANMEDVNLLKKGFTMSAEEVAQIGYNGLMKGKPVIIAGAMNKIIVMGSKISPSKVSMKIVNWLQSKKKFLNTDNFSNIKNIK
ncbi:MAG: SDR family oxidoreductase [Bacteroidetes bacterium]|nr:SDR family oxidoreductase [Bacteroidota bacterium]